MLRQSLLFFIILALIVPLGAQTPAVASAQREFLDEYCIACYSEAGKTGGLSLEKIDLSNIVHGAETWEKVIKKLRTGTMPPQGMPQPEWGGNEGVSLLY
jgi:hypothetical protein